MDLYFIDSASRKYDTLFYFIFKGEDNMSNKIKEFKEKHPKVYNGIKIGGAVILSATAAYFIGKKVGIKKYSPHDAGWYVKSGEGFEEVRFDEVDKFLGCGIARNTVNGDWVCVADTLFKSGKPTLTDVKDLIATLIDKKIADPNGETIFLLLPTAMPKQ